MKHLLILSIFGIFFSCSQQYHCKRCLSGGNVIRDTVRFDTTILVPSVSIDTVLVPYPETSFDTLVIMQDKVRIKFRDLPGPTVYLAADCPQDTVIVEKKIPIQTEVHTGFTLLHIILAVIAGMGVIALLFLLRK